MNDRRLSERIDVNLKTYFNGDNTRSFSGHITNISTGGLFLETGRPLKERSSIYIDIDAQKIGKVIRLKGKVLRKENSGLAVRFVEPEIEELDLLVIAEKKESGSRMEQTKHY